MEATYVSTSDTTMGELVAKTGNPVDGPENYAEMMRLLIEDKSARKVFVNVADA